MSNRMPRVRIAARLRCFNIGGRDGHFLEKVLERAASAGVGETLRARVALKTESRSNLAAENGVAPATTRTDWPC